MTNVTNTNGRARKIIRCVRSAEDMLNSDEASCDPT